MNCLACLLIFLKLGWVSVACIFLSYFFMSIMFPTIFALGIFGLGASAKKASAYIVMAIMGGAMLPKLMGDVADKYDMSPRLYRAAVLFRLRRLLWVCLAEVERRGRGLNEVKAAGGHLRGMARENLKTRQARAQRIMAGLAAAYPRRALRVELFHAVGIAHRHHPFRAMHRPPGQYRDGGSLQEVSRRRRLRRRAPGRVGIGHPAHRPLPQQGEKHQGRLSKHWLKSTAARSRARWRS